MLAPPPKGGRKIVDVSQIHDLLWLLRDPGRFSFSLLILFALPSVHFVLCFSKAIKFLAPLLGLMLILISHGPPLFIMSATVRIRGPSLLHIKKNPRALYTGSGDNDQNRIKT